MLSCQIADFEMARNVTGDNYYTSGGKVPVKWTAPEVQCHQSVLTIVKVMQICVITYRHCIFASIQSKVMFGAMGVYCMRYGVLDIDHLRK